MRSHSLIPSRLLACSLGSIQLAILIGYGANSFKANYVIYRRFDLEQSILPLFRAVPLLFGISLWLQGFCFVFGTIPRAPDYSVLWPVRMVSSNANKSCGQCYLRWHNPVIYFVGCGIERFEVAMAREKGCFSLPRI